ncbi:hypothetical protein P3L10_005969 [Capsicum annuum]
MFECCSEVESKTIFRQRNAIPKIINWSVQCIRPKYESFMYDMFTKHSYKNIQPTLDKVSSLNLSFSILRYVIQQLMLRYLILKS